MRNSNYATLTVRAMFWTVSLFGYAAVILARSARAAVGLFGKFRKSLDIVNFMNFTAGQIAPARAGTIV